MQGRKSPGSVPKSSSSNQWIDGGFQHGSLPLCPWPSSNAKHSARTQAMNRIWSTGQPNRVQQAQTPEHLQGHNPECFRTQTTTSTPRKAMKTDVFFKFNMEKNWPNNWPVAPRSPRSAARCWAPAAACPSNAADMPPWPQRRLSAQALSPRLARNQLP